MVKVYVINISKLKDPLYNNQVMDGLSQKRKEKILKFAKEENRKQSLGAGIILREILPVYGDSQENILLTEKGKPYSQKVCFNLSHSGQYVMGAFSNRDVGCDVEKIDRATFKIADRFFCKGEIQYLEGLNENERNKEFFRLWTCKESYMKMRGLGLSLALNSFEISFNKGAEVLVKGEKQNCFIKEYPLEGYMASVCAMENEFADEITFIEV